VRVYREPKLKNPLMVAAWPGMGYLAKISADYLREQLDAELFAEIHSPQGQILYRKGVAKLSPIRHRFYCYSEKDLVICSGDGQPQSPWETHKLANEVMDVAEKFNVRMIYTMAAFPSAYTGKPRVFGVVNKPELVKHLREHGVVVMEGEGRITGLNGIMIGVARRRKVDGVCLLGQISNPYIPQHRSAQSVLEVLTRMLDVKVDLTALEEQAKKVEESVRKRLKRPGREITRGRKEDLGYVS
jgi:hypothetical protein